MTSFRRFLSIASATFLAATFSLASELSWDFAFAPGDITLSPAGAYTVVSLADGSNVRDAIGAPAIPAKFANILLPDGATDVSIDATGELVLLASDIVPYPVQRVAPKSKPQPPFTAPDPAAYASASPWPAAVATYEGLHDMQGSTFVSVRVNPLVYVASEKALYYRPSVAVTVTYTAPASAPRSTRSVSQNALATEMVNALVVNPEAADSPSAVRRRAAARASTVDYLIITSSTLSNAFQNLANYRATAAGGSYKTLVVTTNTIASSYSGDDIQMKIRNCISNYVKTAGTTYVVLGGDDSVVPDRDCYGNVDNETYEWHMPTDLYYSDLTGTWKASGNTNFGVVAAKVDMSPDVIVGRIPVRTASQLSGYLAKVQAFEADTSHTRNSIIMGGPAAWCRYYGNKRPSDDVTGDGHAGFRASNRTGYVSDSEMWNRRLFRDGIKPYWKSTESSITMKIACDSITSWDSSTCGDKALSSSNLKTWLNAGYTHFMFSGHGYPQGWGMETSGNYSTTQASSQTGLVAFVYTDACLTGAFDEDGIKSSGITVDYGTSDQYTYTSEPCLGEAFVRNSSGGALVHMGCARYGWGTPDASNGTNAEDSDGYYTNYTASASSDGGPSTVYAYKFYKRLYESSAVSSNRTLGAAFAMSKADMISSCSSDGCERWIQFGLNYLGDPAIALYPRSVPDAAPEFSSSTASTNGYVGESIYFDFSDLLSAGYPEPTFTVSTSVSSSLYDWADGLLEFTPSASGTYTFTCTAANGITPNATCTLTVTVTAPPPATPEVPATPPTADSTSFTATWTAVAEAASYKLYVQQKVTASTSARAARDATLLSESFEDGIPSTWSKSASNVTTATGKSGDGDTCVAFKAANVYLMTPALSNPSGISFMYKRSSNTTAWTLDVSVANSSDGPWTSIGTVNDADNSEWKTFSASISLSGTVYVKFTDNRTTGTHERYIDLVQVTGSSDTWEDVPGSPFTVSGTSRTISGLSAGTEYRYAVTAVNSQGVESDPTPYVTVETAEGDSAPAISVEQTSYSTTLGGTDVTFYVTASGSPTPTLALASTTASSADYDFDPDDGFFTFTPSATGTFTFTFTATNSEGSDSATVTVTVSAAPVTVPTLLVDATSDTTAYALWDACTGVTSYTLQLASDNQFTTGGSGGSVTLFSNDGTDATSAPSGWTYNVSDKTSAYLLMFSGHSVVSEAVNASGCTDLSVSLYIRTYGGTSQPNLAIQYSTDNGSTWTNAGTVAAANTTMAQRTLALPAAAASSTLRLRFAPTTTSSSIGVGIKTIVLTGTESSGSGSLISTTTVNGTEYTFTGLTPYTVYYARVKGNADWSNVAEFITDQAAASGPVWSAIPAISVTVGEEIPAFHPANYVSGTPSPTITLSETTASSADYDFDDGLLAFQPTTLGSFTFTFLADNGIGTATTGILTVNSTGTPPAIASISDVTTGLGEPVQFLVTATGTPAPSFSVTGSGTGLDPASYGMTPAGVFDFTPSAIGTYSFTVTATSLAGTDTATFTVTAVRTVPELSVTEVTDTTALASWTACDGVSTYTLQLTDDAFPAASSASRSLTPILTEDFSGFTGNGTSDISGSLNNYTTNSGWTGSKVYCNDGEAKIGASSGQPWITTPSLAVSGSLTVVWEARTYGSSDKYTLLLGISEDGTTFTDTSITLYDDMTVYTNTFEVTGTNAYVRWMGSGSSKARFYLDNVRITTPESGGGDDPGGDSVQTFTVTGTSYTFTDLTPDTAYIARVKGNAGWSEEVYFETLGSAGTAPVWSTLPAQSVTVGGDVEFYPTNYVTGTPFPTVTLDSSTAPSADYDYQNGYLYFQPTTIGTFTFTFIADNGIGSPASATLTVTATGTAPVVTVPQTSYSAVLGGNDVEFTVTATGIPTPTLALSDTTAEAADYDFDENDGFFTFTPSSTGTFTFTFTASSLAGSDSETVTVSVTAAPEPLTDYQQWLQAHGIATDTSADAEAPNGHTYGENYAADIAPTDTAFLDLAITDVSSGQFNILNSSTNRYYQLLYTTDLTVPLESYETIDLGKGATSGSFPNVEGDWYGGLRVTPDEPADP